jgi:hypothetical protein
MPAGKGFRFHHRQSLPPIEPTREPHQDEAVGIGGTLGCNMPLLIQSQRFTQLESFGCECRTGAQTEEQKAHRIAYKRDEQACERHEVAEPPGVSGHH